MFTVDTLLNDGFMGDNHQVIAIQEQVEQQLGPRFRKGAVLKDNDPESANALEKTLTTADQHILIVSGSHGYDFIKKVRKLVAEKKPIVIWVGHQDPGLIAEETLFKLVGLPTHVTEGNPALELTFKERLVAMQAVPNTLKADELSGEKAKWNSTYPEEQIPDAPEGYIGVFLGGDAPEPNNRYHYWSEENAHQLGQKFGQMALQSGKFLLITNGPRTGKFYPNSQDLETINPSTGKLNDPVVRQSENIAWLSYHSLTAEHKMSPDKNRIPHALGAPLDPVSAAFIQGVIDSGLNQARYRFIDFQFGKSAYKAIISALVEPTQSKSIACYSAESISYAEIGYFAENTFGFRVDSMNEGHQRALQRFSEQIHFIGVLDWTRPLAEQSLDITLKQQWIQQCGNKDAEHVAQSLLRMINRPAEQQIPTKQVLPDPLAYAFQALSTQQDGTTPITSEQSQRLVLEQ